MVLSTQSHRGRGADPISVACRICGSTAMEPFVAREMMFGTRHCFTYLECTACGCVQIAEYPDDIGIYYPPDYYSFQGNSDESPAIMHSDRLKEWLVWQLLHRSQMLSKWFLGSTETKEFISRNPLLTPYLKYVPDLASRILDVGCGSGLLLKALRTIHYYRAEGADPFIVDDLLHRGRLLVRKAWLHELSGTYDCISFHHVLEHMPDQLSALQKARTLLSPTGVLIIRIPVAGSDAWKHYRQNWVQLDAPRHYYLHTEASLAILAQHADLDIREIRHDSTAMQFWGSELYERDIPFTDPRSPYTAGPSIFTAEELANFAARAEELNVTGRGDQIIAVLSRRNA